MRLTFIGCGDAFGSGGRLNTCFHLTCEHLDWLVDCGASAFPGLERNAVATEEITTVLVTHFHGDHFAGIPFLILDGLFRNRRTRPLTLVGPTGIRDRFHGLMDAMFPGYLTAATPFELRFIEITPAAPIVHEGVTITAFPMIHSGPSGPCQGYRLATHGRTIAFSGDTAWTDSLLELGRDADLFVCECFTRDEDIPVHLNYATLQERLPAIGARRVILTHMSDDMLTHGADIAEECARDGLTITVD